MGRISKTTACLRFFGDDLDPDEVSRLLGAPPTVGIGRRGVWVSIYGREKVAKTGSWLREARDRSPGDLDAQIAELFADFNLDLAVWIDLNQRFRGDVFCGLFLENLNEGISLRPETLAAVGGRGLTLDFDIYDWPAMGR